MKNCTKKFINHTVLISILDQVQFYFSTLHNLWQSSTITNDLLKEYFLKGTDIIAISKIIHSKRIY